MAPQVNWGWSALNEVDAMKVRIAEMEHRIAELERVLVGFVRLEKPTDERVKDEAG
jgi:hypothetical protein